VSKVDMHRCPDCGAPNPVRRTSCFSCGHPLNESSLSTTASPGGDRVGQPSPVRPANTVDDPSSASAHNPIDADVVRQGSVGQNAGTSLETCAACGCAVSRNALACPRCGDPRRSPDVRLWGYSGPMKPGWVATGLVVLAVLWALVIAPTARNEDIEIQATQTRQGTESILFEGTISNTGSRVAPKVQVWCRMRGYQIIPSGSDDSRDVVERPGAAKEVLAVSFRNLRPGETRPLRAIVGPLYLIDGISDVPQGWKVWSGSPASASLAAGVAH
jgi:hypothetical protein